MTSPSLKLVRREPDKAYVSDMLWLPKSKISEGSVKEALQFWTLDKNIPVLKRLWDETATHIICPREFLDSKSYSNFPFPFIDVSRRKFPQTHLHTSIQLRDHQIAAYDAFSNNRAGVLNLAPGKGKTVLALKKIVDTGCPALIVVHNTYLFEQWQDRVKEFVGFPPYETVGRVQGQEFDWYHPITVAMIHSLASRAEGGSLPAEFFDYFGIVIFDEVHHLSAPLFVTTAPLIQGLRYGLTATHERLDGMEFIYKYHIGSVFYSDLKQDLIPRVYFQLTPVRIDLKSPDVLDVNGNPNIPKMRSYLGGFQPSNDFRAHCIREALAEGRKILALSHSKAQLKNLSEMFPGSGLVIQETPQAQRNNIVQQSQICFCIANLGAEGLDDEALDTLFVLTPFSSPNDLQQYVGRIQRAKAGKRTPVAIVFDDPYIPEFHGLCRKLKKTLKERNMPFEILHAPST